MHRRGLVILFVIGLFVLSAIAQDETIDTTTHVTPPPENVAEAALSSEGFDTAQLEQIQSTQQTFSFQAEVSRMMDILINALYSKREVFLRELISNAADACDKYRYLSLRDGRELSKGLEIKIQADKDKKVLSITDSGVGMSREELINNLGTIAQSGTKKFLEQLKDSKDLRLIGQFGVGFYSAFVVAHTLTVTTRREGETQYLWQSTAGSAFSVSEDPRGNTLEHGTRVSLFLKDDALEFLEPHRLRELVARYSEFIDYPISLWASSEVEVPDETAAEETEPEITEDEEAQAEDNEPAAPKTRKETRWDWELLNKNKPLWARPKEDITDDEYVAFYKAISKDYEAPAAWDHFKAEGAHEFSALIFAPAVPPVSMFDNAQKTTSVRLYVRRVLVNDVFEDLLPRYLAFIWGVVDSDDLPINVSREMLQEHKALTAIKKKLVRKSLEMLKSLADREDQTAYNKFWEGFGKNLKLGIIEDGANRARLAKLLRFMTSKSDGELSSLDAYVERMKEGQKAIYYVAGENREAVERSPFMERLLARNLEVLYLVDPIDEYAVQHMPEFEGHKLVSVMKEGLTLDDDEESAKDTQKEAAEELAPLISFLKTHLAGKVEKVTVSSRLQSSPCVLVTSQYGWSANMERIVRSQALGDAQRNNFMSARKTLEINPDHPIIRDLNARVETDEAGAAETASILYDTALLTSGFSLEDTAGFASRMYKLLGDRVDVHTTHTTSTKKSSSASEVHEEL